MWTDAIAPTVFVFRTAKERSADDASLLAEVRHCVDAMWRQRACATIEVARTHPATRARFELLLHEDGRLRTGAYYDQKLPRVLRRDVSALKIPPVMHIKEVMDWVCYLRVVSAAGIGIGIEGRILEVLGNLRSFRRLRMRLRPYLPIEPRYATPMQVLTALRARIEHD